MYQLGEIVRIKDDADGSLPLCWLEEMNKYHGYTTIVKNIVEGKYYILDGCYNYRGDDYWFTEDWLEPVTKIKQITESEINLLFT